jgi:hypothetical protein
MEISMHLKATESKSYRKALRLGLGLIATVVVVLSTVTLRSQSPLPPCEFEDFQDLSDRVLVEEADRLVMTSDERSLCYVTTRTGLSATDTTRPVTAVLSPDEIFGVFIVRHADACSPDTDIIVFERDRPSPNMISIPIYHNSSRYINWSPDGKALVVLDSMDYFFIPPESWPMNCNTESLRVPPSVHVVDLTPGDLSVASFRATELTGLYGQDWIENEAGEIISFDLVDAFGTRSCAFQLDPVVADCGDLFVEQ